MTSDELEKMFFILSYKKKYYECETRKVDWNWDSRLLCDWRSCRSCMAAKNITKIKNGSCRGRRHKAKYEPEFRIRQWE